MVPLNIPRNDTGEITVTGGYNQCLGYSSSSYVPTNYSQRQFSQHHENNATLVLIIIVLVFIVCETPELIYKIITVITRHVDDMDKNVFKGVSSHIFYRERVAHDNKFQCKFLHILCVWEAFQTGDEVHIHAQRIYLDHTRNGSTSTTIAVTTGMTYGAFHAEGERS